MEGFGVGVVGIGIDAGGIGVEEEDARDPGVGQGDLEGVEEVVHGVVEGTRFGDDDVAAGGSSSVGSSVEGGNGGFHTSSGAGVEREGDVFNVVDGAEAGDIVGVGWFGGIAAVVVDLAGDQGDVGGADSSGDCVDKLSFLA